MIFPLCRLICVDDSFLRHLGSNFNTFSEGLADTVSHAFFSFYAHLGRAPLLALIPALRLFSPPGANGKTRVPICRERIQADKTILNYDEAVTDISASLLKELKVPVSSQTLVFRNRAFSSPRFSPKAPRAVYFNDDTYVGWVNHGQFLEIAHVDPKSGRVFYTLPRNTIRIRYSEHQTEECTVCHDTFQASEPVPRLLMLSVLPNPDGNALKARRSSPTTRVRYGSAGEAGM